VLTVGTGAGAKNWWREVSTASSGAPSARAYHTACEYKGGIVLFGGQICNGGPYVYFNEVFVLSEKLEWSKPEVSGSVPPPRAQHSAVVVRDEMVVHGGCNASTLFGDTFILNLKTWTWRKRECWGEK
jgi:hypothetical protein